MKDKMSVAEFNKINSKKTRNNKENKEVLCVFKDSHVKIFIKPISANGAFGGRKYRTKEYDVFQSSCLKVLPELEIPEGKLELIIQFGFSSSGSDIDNALKQTIDTLSKKYEFNDNRIYKLVATKTIVPKGLEFIEFEIVEK